MSTTHTLSSGIPHSRAPAVAKNDARATAPPLTHTGSRLRPAAIVANGKEVGSSNMVAGSSSMVAGSSDMIAASNYMEAVGSSIMLADVPPPPLQVPMRWRREGDESVN